MAKNTVAPIGATPRESLSDTSSVAPDTTPRYRFRSYRLNGKMEKPWLADKAMKKTRLNNIIVAVLLVAGLVAAGVVAYFLAKPFQQGQYCLVYEDDFKTLNKDVWTHEVQLDGFGNGAFDWTTTDDKNSYIDADGLHIVPTLTNETTSITTDQMYANYTLDLTKDGSCTSKSNSSCFIRSDPTKGAMIPPVRSARLSTKGHKSIRYGRVEVVAKMPKGDWLWPAIWMMPEDDKYGSWPRSGEIDIAESRGNGRDYAEGGLNYYYGTLHWGPTVHTDAYWKTTNAKKLRRGTYADGYHTYGIEWTENYIYFYVDSRVHQILFIGFNQKQPLFDLGNFGRQTDENNTLLDNPWKDSTSTTGNAPFDQKFYLILNVAVGGTNGWFKDKVGGKPWIDDAKNAQWTFWNAASEWLPTWAQGADRGMTVKSVKMWQAGACGSQEL